MWAGVVFVLLAGVPACRGAGYSAYQYYETGGDGDNDFYDKYNDDEQNGLSTPVSTMLDAHTRIKRFGDLGDGHSIGSNQIQEVKGMINKLLYGNNVGSLRTSSDQQEYTDIYDYAEKSYARAQEVENDDENQLQGIVQRLSPSELVKLVQGPSAQVQRWSPYIAAQKWSPVMNRHETLTVPYSTDSNEDAKEQLQKIIASGDVPQKWMPFDVRQPTPTEHTWTPRVDTVDTPETRTYNNKAVQEDLQKILPQATGHWNFTGRGGHWTIRSSAKHQRAGSSDPDETTTTTTPGTIPTGPTLKPSSIGTTQITNKPTTNNEQQSSLTAGEQSTTGSGQKGTTGMGGKRTTKTKKEWKPGMSPSHAGDRPEPTFNTTSTGGTGTTTTIYSTTGSVTTTTVTTPAPNTTTETTTVTTTTITTTTNATTQGPRSKSPLMDINAIIAIIANLTYDYDWNLTEQFNKTLIDHGVPTCPTPSTPTTTTTTPPAYDFANTSVVSKCFVCGLKTVEIPRNAFCADAFAGDFLPLVPVDPRARGHIASFRKYCRHLDVHNFVENPSEPRSIYGRFTGGCGVRWTDLSGVYTQRTCRARFRPLTGKHFGSKRMAKLELALVNVENGCIISPMATLLPLSRGISLYARFHACVCTGSWCNRAGRPAPPALTALAAYISTFLIIT